MSVLTKGFSGLPPESLIAAMKKFDDEYRNTQEWIGWEQRRYHIYAINENNRLYPVKMIVSLATRLYRSKFHGGEGPGNANGLDRNEFHGGEGHGNANEFVRDRGFIIVKIPR